MTETKKFFTGAAQDTIPRDRWSRPLILPAGGGKPIPYQRCTTFVNCLDDTSNLTKWKQRQTILGLLARPALGMAAAAAKDDNRKLNAIVEQAMEAAGSSDAAELGTAIHRFTENYDNGEDISAMPPAYRPDLDAYIRATAEFENLAVEQFVIVDDLQVAGTCDRIVRYRGRNYIADVKTGGIEYGLGKIAMQLAVYAHGTGYNPNNGERLFLPDVSKTAGIIIHLPAGTGTCELVWVNIAAGWEAARDVATKVHAFRKRKDLARPFTAQHWFVEGAGQQTLDVTPARLETSVPQQELAAVEPPVPVPVTMPVAAVALAEPQNMPGTQAGFNKLAAEINAALLSAIGQARSYDELKQIYGLNQTVWTTDHNAAAAARRTELGA